MSDPAPPVSVLMPVYNAERYLSQAADSILAQSFPHFEFIVIDDGSADRSKQILERYAARDARVRLVSRPNTGYAVALNQALALARGEFIARMDADDVSLPDRIALQVDFMRKNPGCVAVGCQATVIDPDGDPVHQLRHRHLDHRAIDDFHLTGQGAMIVHPAAMIRAAALRAVGGYRPELEPAEDLDLWLRLAEIGTLANLPDTLFHYRQHPNSVSRTRTATQLARSAQAAADARTRRGLPPLPSPPNSPPTGTEADVLRGWARYAYWEHNYRAARKHARKVLLLEPARLESWRVFFGATLGPLGRPLYKLLGGQH